MKRRLTLISLAVLFCTSLFAQGEFKKEWQTKVTVQPTWNAYNDDLSLILVGDLKAFQMLDGSTGQVLWTFNAKEKLGVKSVEDWFFLTKNEGEPVKIIYKKPKEKDNTILFLNPRTGETESSMTEQSLKNKAAETKKKSIKTVFAHAIYDEPSNTYIHIKYNDKLVKSAMGGGTELDMTITASGGNKWSTTIKGKALRHLCDNLLSSYEPDMMMNLMAANGKVFVVYEGISVLDLATGKLLWSTTFDNVQSSVGLSASQEIGRSPMPATDKDAVYICDFSKGEKAIKKLDLNTGKVLWEGEKLSNNDVVSQLFVVNNTLIAKFGGIIRKEKFIPDANGGVGAGTYKVKYEYEGETSIRAYDIATGKQKWVMEKTENGDNFKKSECDLLLDGNKLIACSDKFLYILDPESGSTVAKADLGAKEIDTPQSIFIFNDSYIVEGKEGLASFSKSGSRNYATSTGKRLFTEFRGNAFIVWTGKDTDDMNEFIRFDLASGKIIGMLKGCYKPRFNSTGDYFLRFNKEVVTRYSTN